MSLRRIVATTPVAILLALASLAAGPGSQSAVLVRVAGVLAASPTPTATDTPTPTFTPTPTDTPTPVPTSTPTPTPTFTPAPTDASHLHLRAVQVSRRFESVSPWRSMRDDASTRIPYSSPVRVPILMYHYISVPPPDADKYRLDLSVTPANFEAQVEYLAIQGYHAIRLSDLAEALLNGAPLPDQPIVLTLDDGYSDNYENAFPILKNYGFPATFFVITQFVESNKPGYMNWNQLEEMAMEGMEIGSHSVDHPDLRGKSRAFQNLQIAGSKALIESRIGTPVQSFSYPAGRYDAITLDVLRANGYLAAVTEIQGTRQSPNSLYELRRIRIRGSYSLSDFAYWLKYFSENGR